MLRKATKQEEIFYNILAIFAVGPLILSLIGLLGTSLFNCHVSEEGHNVCMAFGNDVGDILSGLCLSAWYILGTIPIAAAIVLSYRFISFLLHILKREE